jgi:hypothetical protein
MSPVALRSEKGCNGKARQKLTRLLVREGAPHQQTRNCQQQKMKERRGKIDRGSQLGA